MSGRRGLPAVARVALATTITLTIGITIVVGVSYAAVSRDLRAAVDRDLLEESRAFSAALGQETLETRDELVESARAYLSAREPGSTLSPILIVRLLDGSVISNSDLTLERAWEDAAAAPGGGFTTVSYEGVTYRVATAALTSRNGDLLGTFHASLALDTVYAIRTDLARALASVGLAAIVLGSLLSYWVARAALAPLARVAATAGHISDARLAERVSYDGPRDEVGSMVAALNAMLDRLEAAFGEQRRFVADASHELRTPLSVVRGNLELLERERVSDADRAEALDAVRDELRRMERLIDDLLALARLESGALRRPFQPLDVGVLLAEVAARARVLGDLNITVEAPDDVWVTGDPDLLEQALANIVRNAVRHTADGGTIRLASHAEGDHVCLAVSDDGPGIPEAHLPRVFDRFYRGPTRRDEAGGGSGLGLAITRRLVELHGGSVRAENGAGGGAVFTVELPRSEPG
ncbi:MAG: HAMP domain-containing histidine kinase [Coriobacteriia bacterium]|nr:HAMP domain-containing histidine kinase [Coriobacteriia bacterium]